MKTLSLFEPEKNWWHNKQLKSLLVVLKNFIDQKSYIPVLSTIYFNKNLMIAINLDMRLEIDFDSNINKCLPYRELQKLNDKPISTLSNLKGNTFQNERESIVIKNTLNITEFPPPITLSKILWSGKITPVNLIGLEQIANEITRELTSHVTVEIDKSELVLHATDGFMSKILRTTSNDKNIIFSIPSYSIVPLLQLIKFFNVDTIECYFDDSTIVFSSPGYFKLFMPVNLEITIPKYDKIYQINNPVFTASLNNKLTIPQLTKIIQNHSLSRDEPYPIPNIELSDNLYIEIDESQYKINWQTDCTEKHLTSFNLVKLKILLGTLKNKQITFGYIDQKSPLLIKGGSEIALLMPIKE